MILYDNGWDHTKGIQRFSDGVLDVLKFRWEFLFQEGESSRVAKLLSFQNILVRNQLQVFYSPGYIDYPYAKKRIITIHDLIQIDSYTGLKKIRALSYYSKYLKPRILDHQIQVCTVSQMSQERIIKWLGTQDIKIIIASPGLSSPFKENINLNFKKSPQIILVTSEATHKGFDYFAKASWYLKEKWKIVIVGITNLQKYEIDPRHNYKTFHSVTDNELLKLYNSSSILCIPSTMEGFCIPALEGASQGLRVVFFNHIKTIHEISGKLGNAVDLSSGPEGLASSIEKTFPLSSELTLSEMIRIRSEYSWNETLLPLNNFLRSLQDY